MLIRSQSFSCIVVYFVVVNYSVLSGVRLKPVNSVPFGSRW